MQSFKSPTKFGRSSSIKKGFFERDYARNMNAYRINGRSISQYNRIQPYLAEYKWDGDFDARNIIDALYVKQNRFKLQKHRQVGKHWKSLVVFSLPNTSAMACRSSMSGASQEITLSSASFAQLCKTT